MKIWKNEWYNFLSLSGMVLKMKDLFLKWNAYFLSKNLALETSKETRRIKLCREFFLRHTHRTGWWKFSMGEVGAWRDSRVNCMQATWWNSEFEWIIEKVHRSTSTGYSRAASVTLYCAPEISMRRDKSSNRNS